MRSLCAATWLACWVLAGCAGGITTQAGGWVQVDTEHVRLRTDLGLEEAVAFAEDLQQHRDALVDIAFDCGSAQLAQPTRITFFANEEAFDAVAPRDATTIVEGSRAGLVDMAPELLMKPNRHQRVLRQAALHEMGHALSAECYPGLPSWLSEGLALFYETSELEEDALVLGRQKYAIVRQDELAAEIARARPETIVVPHAAVPRLVELLAYGFGEFYRYIDYYDTLQERERILRLGRYAGAWALTHSLFTVDESTNARLRRFMLEVRFGEATLADAWSTSMRGIDIARLYEDWTSIGVRYPVIAYGYRSREREAARVRALTEAEVELHLAARWDWTDEKGRGEATAHLARAMELDPGNPGAYLMRAAVAAASGADAEAGTWLYRAVDLAPDDPAVLRSELVFRFFAPEVPASAGRSIDDVAAALVMRATTASQYDALARYFLEAGSDTMEARYWAARALRRDPSCASCRVTAGELLEAAGQPSLAISMYRGALTVAAHDPHFDRASVLESIEALERAAP